MIQKTSITQSDSDENDNDDDDDDKEDDVFKKTLTAEAILMRSQTCTGI